MLNVEVFDNKFHDLIDISQEMKLLGNFGGFVEGLIWCEKRQELTFNSLGNQKTWRWIEETSFMAIRENTNVGNGMAYDTMGRIIICEQTGFRVARMSWDIADYQIIATGYNGRPLNSPNDVVVHSNGMIYFSDPAFGRRPGLHGYFGRQQQPCQGIYSIHPETLQVVLVTDELDNPNGLCFSPDESKMYFAETSISQLTVMDVLKDGSLGNKKLFSYSVNKGHGTPDGIKVDVDGNVWCTAEGGIQVFNIEGTILGLIYTPEVSGNLCFGGKGMNTLFIGSGSNLFTVLLKAKGQSLRR